MMEPLAVINVIIAVVIAVAVGVLFWRLATNPK